MPTAALRPVTAPGSSSQGLFGGKLKPQWASPLLPRHRPVPSLPPAPHMRQNLATVMCCPLSRPGGSVPSILNPQVSSEGLLSLSTRLTGPQDRLHTGAVCLSAPTTWCAGSIRTYCCTASSPARFLNLLKTHLPSRFLEAVPLKETLGSPKSSLWVIFPLDFSTFFQRLTLPGRPWRSSG